MEPVGAWGPAQVAAWLRGLDAAVQGYPFEAWGLAGAELLGLSAGALEALGVRRVGHQELLLDAVEQLRALDTELASTSLRTLTEGLRDLAQRTQTLVLEGMPGAATPQPPPFALLACVVDLIGAAKGLFSWLNRYLFSTLNDFSASRDIVLLCARLAEVLQAVGTRGGRGLDIISTSSCLHFVSATNSEVTGKLPESSLPALPLPQALAAQGGRILPGDEIVQVNEQVVVGWTRTNLAKKLLEKASGVTLVLKKVPLSPPGSPLSPRQQVPGAFSDAADPPAAKSSECPGSPVSLTSSAAADVDSGPDSAPDPGTDDEDECDPSLPGEDVGELPPAPLGSGAAGDAAWEASTPPGTPCSPRAPTRPRTAELSPLAAPGAGAQGAEPSRIPGEGSPETGRRPKGVATRLSRRRVSCRDLGRVDCDGWLLKKKDHVGFMAQKWKRCWFVLKGHTLYWYHHPNDEKAAGLINLATYNLESTREQKKKYVFQLSHERYKPFIFAAETLADLSMWVSHLVTAKTKHALGHQPVPHREEDCYSETEAEDPDDESPRQGCDSPKKRLQNPPEKGQLFPTSGESSSAASSPQGSPRPRSPEEPGEEDLESLMQCLKQGGVSLIGRQRFLTQEQCRKSFIRRNKNPHVNEKVHAVRALQSTLKAKLAELQALEQLLDDDTLTSEKFSRWKEEHQDLYQELQECWAQRQGQGSGGGDPKAEQSPPGEAAKP
ncbi:connector enhancer of kinase suppressor of ras 1 [Oxyura jamaicensis]|uniref:connector enhancer of kinase suppressor of ras 1 n=1 Tax=Oxyura jamaicensis TaxID=8884 RepID=UPI0015A5FBB7|nr:connector enhancer of kinase suppressor of ras 1 [Oxyura jamaicensis]